jgi:hypothetical protein
MCRPGLGSKPRLRPGFRRLGLSKFMGRAQALGDGLAQAWLGLSRGPSTEYHAILVSGCTQYVQ